MRQQGANKNYIFFIKLIKSFPNIKKIKEEENVGTYWSYCGRFANKCLLFPALYMTQVSLYDMLDI